MNDEVLVTALYLVTSVATGSAFLLISRKLSGPSLSALQFWLFFTAAVLWGMVHWGIARNGHILFLAPSQRFFEENYCVRWIAFLSAVFQSACMPTRRKTAVGR